MSVFVALSSSNPHRVACVLEPFAASLRLPATIQGGFGIGYFNDGEILQRVEPREIPTALDVPRELAGLEGDLFILHAREATVGPVRRENTHPFRFGHWLFAHNGTIAGFADIRERLREAMPPFILRGVHGTTDSEHLFHLFLSFLNDAGQVDRADIGALPVREALVRAVGMVDELSRQAGHEPAPFAAVVADGYSLVVAARAQPVCFQRVDGLVDCQLCRGSVLPGAPPPEPVRHDDVRAVIIVAGAALPACGQGFERLADASVLSVDRRFGLEICGL